MFYQYKIFVAKEFKQLCRCKKIILFCFLMFSYTPILNCISTPENSIIPFDFAIPLLVLWACIYPSELTYSIMKEEYTSKSIEILFVSKVKPIIIILSKLTLPIIISFIIAIVSIVLNNLAVAIVGSGILIDGLDPYYLFILLSTIILDASIFLYLMLIGGTNLHKNVFTAICTMVIFVTSLIFALYYYISFWLAASLLILTSAILLYINVNLIKKSKHTSIASIKKKRNYMIFNNHPFLNLCLESSCRYLNIKELIMLTISILVFNIGLVSLNYHTPYLCVPYFIVIANSLIFRSTLIETKYKSFKYFRLAHTNLLQIIFSRIAIPLIFCFFITIITLTMQNTLTILNILNMLLISVFVCLTSLLCSLFIKNLKYEKQYTLIATLILFSLTFSIVNLQASVITLLTLVLYGFNMYYFHKRSCCEV